MFQKEEETELQELGTCKQTEVLKWAPELSVLFETRAFYLTTKCTLLTECRSCEELL